MSRNEKTIEQSRYSIVTPARNEEAVLHETVQSVINQSIKPQKWVILNDGSTDGTAEILNSYAKTNSWIEVVHTEKKVKSYKGAQEKLKMAFDRIDIDQNDFIGKLDADIELESTYYENLIKNFHKDQKLGIGGGTLFCNINGNIIKEHSPEYHVRGGLKFYRKKCWNDINGMEFKLGYDTIDEIKAYMFGWKTRSFDNIKALHHRPTGQQKGVIGWHLYRGKLQYLVGYHPFFLICKSVKDMTERPFILSGLFEMFGFFRCYLDKTERSIDDPDFIKFIRRNQIRRIFFGLFRAT